MQTTEIKNTFEEVRGNFSTMGGIIAVKQNGKWGFMCESGAMITPFQFSDDEVSKIINSSSATYSRRDRSIVGGLSGLIMYNDRLDPDMYIYKNILENSSYFRKVVSYITRDLLPEGHSIAITKSGNSSIKRVGESKFTCINRENKEILPLIFNKKDLFFLLERIDRDIREKPDKSNRITVADGLAANHIVYDKQNNHDEYFDKEPNL